ncbi:Uncharacterized membrane-anchored protein [Lutibacter agarilyticus]|uniref:Uncharacterized membrane-anchored protein n=1 Tax=Lutibacter agarilyticus TaxID=1109740 RepID=A0A238W6C0_9FLAO|nr:GDYXXLXY domain-containing protein [Lutibacter agarilyticus]SNR41967.1 Uncharacterized membrane-anchored protein [Lutibacter agarilyticus]
MKKFKWILILVNLIILVGLFTNSIIKKEAILSNGKLILLELAPVDPRSLMQGDYMQLRYKISEESMLDSISKRGFIVVAADEKGIAQKIRIQPKKTPINTNEYLIEYIAGNMDMNIGAEAFFFEEGQGEKFEKATYGGLMIDDQGNSILMGLYDENLNRIE